MIRNRIAILAVLAVWPFATPAAGQQKEDPGWYNTTELTAVWTGGNSPASTFGLKNDLRRVWPRARFRLEAGGVRTQGTKTSRTATGTLTDFAVEETRTTAITAQSYYARSRYDREVGERSFVFAGAGWTRNTFAGVRNRYTVVAGAGNRWVDGDGTLLKSDYGFTYNIQDDVVETPGRDNSFAGLRVTAEAQRAISATTKFHSQLITDENLKQTKDLRADWTNALTVSINSNLALKTSYEVLYDNQPSLASIPLLLADGSPSGDKVAVPLKKVDSVFTVALVVNF